MVSKGQAMVLLIEDDAIFRRRYRRELSKFYEVHEASNLREALDLIENNNFRYVLSDLHLSKGQDIAAEGLQAIAKVKGLSPTTFVSAMSSDVDLKQEAINSGADTFTEKPFSISEIIATWSKI